MRALFSSYVAQAKEYVASVQGSSEARQIVQRALNLKRISEYQIVLVCGFAEENDPAQITQILAGHVPAIKVLYFDEIVDQLAREYERHYRGAESRGGWATVYHLGFPENPVSTRSYISDGGGKERDRISIFRERDQLVAECLDSAGRAHAVRADIPPGTHYILFEFSTDAAGIYMSLTVDDDLHALVLGRSQFQCDPDMSNYVFGADLNGGSGAEFDMYQSLFVNRTLSLDEKLGMYGYSLEKIASATGFLKFYRSSFMRSIPEGALIQADEARKPILMPKGVRIGRIDSKVPSNAPKPRP